MQGPEPKCWLSPGALFFQLWIPVQLFQGHLNVATGHEMVETAKPVSQANDCQITNLQPDYCQNSPASTAELKYSVETEDF